MILFNIVPCLALPSLTVVAVIVAVTLALERGTGASGRYQDEKEAFFPIISTNHMEQNSFNGYPYPDIHMKMSKKTCGQQHPLCTSECFHMGGYCNCKNRNAPSKFHMNYVLPCRAYSKMCKAGEHESYDYSKIHPQHSAALPPNHRYTFLRHGVTNKEMQEILKIHNNYRAKVARGDEHRSRRKGVSQPSGSNIKEFIWNYELAYIAQKWAEQCDFNHESPSFRRSPCSRPYQYLGQNLYKSSNPRPSNDNEWARAISLWYGEVIDTPIRMVKHYTHPKKMIGHYTQMLWGSTYEIGCGAVYYKEDNYKRSSVTLYVCNYGPGGNTIGMEMYKIGSPASKCGKSGKSVKYKGLCAP